MLYFVVISSCTIVYFAGTACVQNRIYLGMTTIKDLIIKRPNLKSEFLDILLYFTSHEKSEVSLLSMSGFICMWIFVV